MIAPFTLISFQGACHFGFGIVVAFLGTSPSENGTLLSPVVANARVLGAILSSPPEVSALLVILCILCASLLPTLLEIKKNTTSYFFPCSR